ncbi:MAG: putative addiction module antidote protein [Burkholderiaceae bacterium]|nr:putative addiction module antidote protein [Burkholderiaceae bacterium]
MRTLPFLWCAFETGDAAYIAKALGVVALAKRKTQRRKTGLSREQPYRSFGENGNPTLKTTLALMKADGVVITATIHA